MTYELSLALVTLLIATGLIAGFVNALAGGGSFLTLPSLMLLGIPADIANATNRVAVLVGGTEAIRSFHKRGLLDSQAIMPLMMPLLAGAVPGSLLASYLPVEWLEPVILLTLISVALAVALRPDFLPSPDSSAPESPGKSLKGFAAVFFAGLYGGFIQAGVGFVLIAALCGVLRYDLIKANALKAATTVVFTVVAMAIFVVRDQVLWIPGLLVALGSVIGTNVAIRFAVSIPQQWLRWLLLVLVCAISLAVWLR